MAKDSIDEGPDSADLSDDSMDDVLDPCPRCKRAVYHDVERCPHCGHYLNAEDEDAPRMQPKWVIVTAVVCLIVFIYLAGEVIWSPLPVRRGRE